MSQDSLQSDSLTQSLNDRQRRLEAALSVVEAKGNRTMAQSIRTALQELQEAYQR